MKQLDYTPTKRQDKLNQILKDLFGFYHERELQLVKILYRKGVTIEEIARELGVTRQAISLLYPKTKLMEGGEK